MFLAKDTMFLQGFTSHHFFTFDYYGFRIGYFECQDNSVICVLHFLERQVSPALQRGDMKGDHEVQDHNMGNCTWTAAVRRSGKVHLSW